MSNSIFWILVFILSLLILIKGSGYFIEAADKIGLYFGIPSFIVGVILLTLGTTLPELSSSFFAVARNSSEIVAGTVIGSNIVNICLVLGVAVLFTRGTLKINYGLENIDLPIFVGSALLLTLAVSDGRFTRGESLLSLALLVVYAIYSMRKGTNPGGKEIGKVVKKKYRADGGLNYLTFVVLALSAVLIYFGAKYIIDAVINLSSIFNIAKDIIAVSAIALGTSLPELAVALMAARKGKAEMAVGNVLGANMVNTLAVMGIPGLMGTLVISKAILSFSLPVMLASTFLYFLITRDGEITKWEGYLLLIFYVFFLGKVLNLL